MSLRVITLVGMVISLICGVFMLKARNWTRWVIVGYWAASLVASFFMFRNMAFLLPRAVPLALVAIFLFRRPASEYFKTIDKNERAQP